MANIKEVKTTLQNKVVSGEKTLGINIDQFLMSNRRVDRDRVIKKRQEILTIKNIINELF